MKRQKGFIVAILVLTALVFLPLFSHAVLAIAITPGRTIIDFSPGLEKDVHFTVINNEHKDMNVVLYVMEGPMSQYVQLYESIVEFSKTDQSKSFMYSVRLPESIDTPGDHIINIVAMDVPGGESGQTRVGATTSVVSQALIRVPYPGKYAEAELIIGDAVPGEFVEFFVQVKNLGKEDILRAKATIDILGPTNEKIATLESAEASMGPNKRKEFMIIWDEDPNPGIYHAVVSLSYDTDIGGRTVTISQNFAVGEKYIEILEILVDNFRLGQVAKFDISIKSKWNKEIKDVFGNMLIEDDDGGLAADIKTASLDMAPFEKAELNAYWDTNGITVGNYNASFTLSYEGATTVKDLLTHVSVNDISVDILDLGAGAVTADAGGDTTENILIFMVVVLIAINAAWFLYFRKRR